MVSPPVFPRSPVAPVSPVDPVAPVDPGVPGDPGDPGVPGAPDGPDGPAGPGTGVVTTGAGVTVVVFSHALSASARRNAIEMIHVTVLLPITCYPL